MVNHKINPARYAKAHAVSATLMSENLKKAITKATTVPTIDVTTEPPE